jgi:hypothetical protein
MASLALLASGGALLAAFGATGELGFRSEIRARSPVGSSAPAVLTEVEIDPRGALRVGSRVHSLTLSYEPRLLFSDVTSAPTANLMNNLQARADFQLAPSVSLFAAELASYGRTDFTSLTAPSQTNAAPQSLPSARDLYYLSTSTGAGLDWRLSRELRAEAQISYQISGGADGHSRPSLPLQRGPQASAALALALSRRDSLVTQLSVVQSEFTNKPRPDFSDGSWALAAYALETWRHVLSRAAEARFAAGLGLAQTEDRPNGLEMKTSVLPVGEAGINLRPASMVQAGLSARAAPFVDRLTGSAYERAEASVDLAVSASPNLQFTGRGGYGRALGVGPQRGDFAAGFELGAGYALRGGWRLALGTRGAWQRVQGVSLTQWSAFAGAQFASSERF